MRISCVPLMIGLCLLALSGCERHLTQSKGSPKPLPSPSINPAGAAHRLTSPDLQSIAVSLAILELDDKKAVFSAGGPTTITLTVSGPPWKSIDKDGKPISVHLLAVDLDNARAQLGGAGQTIWLDMF